VPRRDSHIPTTQCEVWVLKQILQKREAQTRVLSQKRKVRVQSGLSLKHTELKIPHPQGFETSPLDTPATDLRDYLTKKRSVHQITPQCCCERLITIILFECHCNSHTSKSSVFNWLSAAPVSNSAKRCRSRKKKSFSNVEYPEVTSNMVGPCTTPSKPKGKQSVVCSGESDDEPSSSLKEILRESEGVY